MLPGGIGLLLSPAIILALPVTTWNPADVSGTPTLSNGNRTVTGTATTNGIRGVAGYATSSGDYAFQAAVDAIGSTAQNSVGIGTTSAALNGAQSGLSNAITYNKDGSIYNNSTTRVDATGPTYTAGDLIIVRLSGTTCYFYKNGTLVATLPGVAAGTYYPMVRMRNIGTAFTLAAYPTLPAGSPWS